MKHIIEKLDNLATKLENKGLMKEASDIDVISNTIEKLSYSVERDKAYINMGNAVQAINQGRPQNAKGFLQQIRGNMEMKNQQYGNKSSDVRESVKLYNDAAGALSTDTEAAQVVPMLQGSMQYLKKAEPFINKAQMSPI